MWSSVIAGRQSNAREGDAQRLPSVLSSSDSITGSGFSSAHTSHQTSSARRFGSWNFCLKPAPSRSRRCELKIRERMSPTASDGLAVNDRARMRLQTSSNRAQPAASSWPPDIWKLQFSKTNVIARVALLIPKSAGNQVSLHCSTIVVMMHVSVASPGLLKDYPSKCKASSAFRGTEQRGGCWTSQRRSGYRLCQDRVRQGSACRWTISSCPPNDFSG